MTAGQYVTDGTAIFIVRDMRDGTPVGRPITDDVLRDSYVKRNGALLQRSSYPTLVKFLQDNPILATTEASWPNAKNLWTWGDGNSITGTTIRVPDERGLYIQLSDAVGLVAAGVPNILGEFSLVLASPPHGLDTNSASGVFSKPVPITGNVATTGGTGMVTKQVNFGVNFSARNSSIVFGNSTTVTPPSVRRISQMKY